MSDIGIRFDGFVLLAAVLLGAAIYLLVALGAIGVALCNKAARPRAWRVARASGLMAAATLTGFLILLYYWSEPYGVFFNNPWPDWATIPWGVIFVLGCWGLTRIR